MSKNHLYPIFVKTHDIKTLVVGGGYVCHEKLNFLLKSSPESNVTIVAPMIRKEVLELIDRHPEARIKIRRKTFEPTDVDGHQLVLSATCFEEVNRAVQVAANQKGILVNVADQPAQCDFFLGSIITKGQVKIAVSTNGQSPTLAKRMRQFLEQLLPEEIDQLAETLHTYRSQLNLEFEDKVKHLNALTESLIK